jgi:hypothetical protein
MIFWKYLKIYLLISLMEKKKNKTLTSQAEIGPTGRRLPHFPPLPPLHTTPPATPSPSSHHAGASPVPSRPGRAAPARRPGFHTASPPRAGNGRTLSPLHSLSIDGETSAIKTGRRLSLSPRCPPSSLSL